MAPRLHAAHFPTRCRVPFCDASPGPSNRGDEVYDLESKTCALVRRNNSDGRSAVDLPKEVS